MSCNGLQALVWEIPRSPDFPRLADENIILMRYSVAGHRPQVAGVAQDVHWVLHLGISCS